MTRFFLWSLLPLLLGACASYTQESKEMRQLYGADRYQEALAKLEESSLKDESKNRLLYRLEKASLLDRLHDRPRSRKLLVEADKIADELYTTSVSKSVASFVVNDAATDYEGEDYEKVFIHTLLAASFLEDGDLAAAKVEARKINNKIQEINQKYEGNKNRYGEDAFARFLSGLIYEAGAEWDSAIIDYKAALALYEGAYRDFNDSKIPNALITSLYRILLQRGRSVDAAAVAKKYPSLAQEVERSDGKGAEAGEVVVIHEIGTIAFKENNEFFLPIGGQVIRFSHPVIKKRSFGSYGNTGIEVDGANTFYPAAQAANLTDIASSVLDDKRGRLIIKEGARLVAKAALTESAYKNFGLLGGVAANVYSAVSETGDTRSWTLLPHSFLVSKARLKPGSYTIKIKGGAKIARVEKVQIQAGKTLFFRAFD